MSSFPIRDGLIGGRVERATHDVPTPAAAPLTPRRSGLRLVGADGRETQAGASSDAARAVSRENAAAARLSATDARWIMALRVYEQLEGGRSAILQPSKRRRLVEIGRALGLRPFDANLVIAVVQDAARRGETPASTKPHATLSMVPGAAQPMHRADRGASWGFVAAVAAALLLGTLAAASAILWLKSG
ncbi:MAG: hypothetical protein AAGI30_03025 [Planctomycetota bacterium]